MPLHLYNTLTRRLEDFKPLRPPAVTMYVCGPTVYDVPHIGHARSAYIFDVLRRYLTYKTFEVTFVRNVTDVDDKIIAKAREELGTGDLKAKCREVAERSLKSYHDALDRLGIQPPDKEPKATEHVLPDNQHIDASMTGFIAQLLVKGAAYEAGGDVYFAVRKFPGYGKLSNRSIDELQSGARVDPGEHKQDPLDFALWKTAKPDEPSWNSPWGNGRPGWHIECSVMSTRYLGDAFDIHGGGVDLVFPHHENEIAQVQALDKPFAKYWIHNGLLTVNGEKMSKSVGNFITIEQALKDCGQNSASDILKLFFLSAHYRSPINYMLASVTAAAQRYEGYRNLMDLAGNPIVKSGAKKAESQISKLEELKGLFVSALDDDLNTPEALSALDGMRSLGWQLWNEVQQGVEESKGAFLSVVAALKEHGELLGLFEKLEDTHLTQQINDVVEDSVKARVDSLVKAREEDRRNKDFASADRRRQEISDLGYIVEDTPLGPVSRKQRARNEPA